MPKPNGDNKLTKDLLKLRPHFEEVKNAEEPNDIRLSISLEGPQFKINISAEGAPWVVRKLLQDLDSSLGQLW